VERYVFWPMAVLSVTSALLMIRARNTVHAALLLVGNFFTLAVLYVLLEAHFLAAVQVIIYAGAIMVLFLFVIMLLGVDREDAVEETIPFLRLLRPATYVLAAGFAGILVWMIRSTFSGLGFAGLTEANASGNTQEVGRILFNKYVFPFEVASVLLIIAAIGAMVLGRRRDEEEEASGIADGPAPPSLAEKEQERV
jgi:NADH-quinone oxidoreductase subunit J